MSRENTLKALKASLAAIPDDELAEEARQALSDACKRGRLRMSMPPSPRDDDMLLNEVIKRFEQQHELERLFEMVDAFAAEMKEKLRLKHEQGYGGWDDPDLHALIVGKLREHVERGEGQRVDVANLAAMLWHQETRTK